MKKLLLFGWLVVFLFLFSSPVLANGDSCWTDCVEDEVATIQCIECIFKNFLNIATTLAGLAVFIMFLAGGFKYLTSAGDPKGTESAKSTLTYAVLGLVLVIVAWFILQFIKEFTGVEVTEFEIPK
jgi:hypothetical protein